MNKWIKATISLVAIVFIIYVSFNLGKASVDTHELELLNATMHLNRCILNI